MQQIHLTNSAVHITTNTEESDLDNIYKFLTNEAYWIRDLSYDNFLISIKNSLCFGIFINNVQIGLARLVTDYISIAYLCDVFVLKEHRGLGYGKKLLEYIFQQATVKATHKILLATSNTHGLYEKFLFKLVEPGKYMERRK
jgi:GNAT superfamily N-acetyltransferase